MGKLNNTQEIIGADVLDHLGWVAATIDKLGCPLPLNEFSKTIIRTLAPYFFNLEDTKMLDKYLNSSF